MRLAGPLSDIRNENLILKEWPFVIFYKLSEFAKFQRTFIVQSIEKSSYGVSDKQT